jgi:hypothetical protein
MFRPQQQPTTPLATHHLHRFFVKTGIWLGFSQFARSLCGGRQEPRQHPNFGFLGHNTGNQKIPMSNFSFVIPTANLGGEWR